MANSEELHTGPHTSVELGKLVEGTALPFDVFIKDNNIFIPLFSKGTMYNSSANRILREKGITTIYVKDVDGPVLEQYVAQQSGQRPPVPDPETFKRYIAEKDSHFVVDRSFLIMSTKVTFSLYSLNNFSLGMLVEADEKTPAIIDSRVLTAPGDIVIKPTDVPLYNAYINALLATGAVMAKDREKVKRAAIKENSKMVLKDLLENPRSGEKIKESITLVNKMVDSILENRDAAHDMLTLRTYDYYTYTHSVNVAVLSVGLGVGVGLPREELEKLGIGAMLHDVGKQAISPDIINKPGRLTDDEFRIIKTHVTEGEKILRENHDIPDAAFFAVSQHHERLSGKGYPHNRSGQDIHPFGRITSIVDCYDALTTERSYQQARTPFFALSILTREGGDYDVDYLKVFIKMLGEIKQ